MFQFINYIYKNPNIQTSKNPNIQKSKNPKIQCVSTSSRFPSFTNLILADRFAALPHSVAVLAHMLAALAYMLAALSRLREPASKSSNVAAAQRAEPLRRRSHINKTMDRNVPTCAFHCRISFRSNRDPASEKMSFVVLRKYYARRWRTRCKRREPGKKPRRNATSLFPTLDLGCTYSDFGNQIRIWQDLSKCTHPYFAKIRKVRV